MCIYIYAEVCIISFSVFLFVPSFILALCILKSPIISLLLVYFIYAEKGICKCNENTYL